MEIRQVYVRNEPSTVLQIVSVYQKAFGECHPWFEGYLCPVCQHTLPLDSKIHLCPKCLDETDSLIEMVEYWPTAKVISDFYSQTLQRGSLCFIAHEKNVVLGFAWGYPLVLSKESALHLDAPDLENQDIDHRFFYLDECAVLPKYQKLRIGRQLVESMLEHQPFDSLILRTKADSPMSHLIESLSGKTLLRISQDRIIMEIKKQKPQSSSSIFPHY